MRGVAGGGEPALGGLDHPHAVERARDLRRVVGGAIGDDDHLVVGIAQPATSPPGIPAASAAPLYVQTATVICGCVGAPSPGAAANASFTAASAGFGRALARGQAEVPVEDLVAAAVPRVGPREHERAGAPRLVARFELPAQRVRLLLLAVAAAVEADLRHQQRAFVGEVLQTAEVAFELLAPLEVDVERQEVEVTTVAGTRWAGSSRR